MPRPASAACAVRSPCRSAARCSASSREKGAASVNIKEGGDQIECEDQDTRIHRIWLDEMKKNGVEPKMEKFFPSDARTPVMAK
jgi:hypothetical protein